MRRAPIHSLVLFAMLATASSSQAFIIKHTEPRRMDEVAFTRFGELLGVHGMVDPTRVVLFSEPTSHTGLYFETELDTQISNLPKGSEALLEIITADDQKTLEFHFPIPAVKSHAKALYLGVTGEPFNTVKKKELPKLLAWRVSILSDKGDVLARAPSAVWGR